MKINTILKTVCFALCLSYSASYAQIQDSIPISKPRNKYLKKLGIGIGIGASKMDLKKVNQRLVELNIGTLDNYLASRTISLYGGNDQIGISIDLDWETAFENTLIHPKTTFLNLDIFLFGYSFYHAILNTRRLDIRGTTGFRYAYMALEYNTNTVTTTSFGSLFTTPTSTVVRLTSRENYSLPIGIAFQYQLGKLENKKPRAYTIGFDTGYTYCVSFNEWREAGSKIPVADMPTIKPTNFYLRFTFS